MYALEEYFDFTCGFEFNVYVDHLLRYPYYIGRNRINQGLESGLEKLLKKTSESINSQKIYIFVPETGRK